MNKFFKKKIKPIMIYLLVNYFQTPMFLILSVTIYSVNKSEPILSEIVCVKFWFTAFL